MKNPLKLTTLLALVLLVSTFGCKKEDEINRNINVQDLTLDLDENPTDGQTVGTVLTDGSGDLSFSITSQTPAGALSINPSTGELMVANATLFDFETNPVITATISVENGVNTATVTINLNDVAEIGVEDLTIDFDENPSNGQIVGTVQADGSGDFSITSQTPAGALSINPSTGELTVANATLFDFETNPVITATISVVDGINTATVTINLNNVAEINVEDLDVTIDENPTNGQVIGTVLADGSGDFSITSQTPTGALSINPSTGELTVADATLFDFETNPVITATILVVDGNTATVTINLTNVPEVSDLTIGFDENPTNGQVVGTVPNDGSGALSIASQTPAGALSINPSTGELTVADATLFDFETNPVITATISIIGGVSTATVTIDLNNINEIGDFNYGGVIFWVNATNDGGYVVSISDQSAGLQWYNGTFTVTGATGTAIGTGQVNSTAIVNNQGAGTYAAQLCNDLSLSGYSDWFLPSKDEMNEVYVNRVVINATIVEIGGIILSNSYWTSTEWNLNLVWFQSFSNGFQGGTSKNSTIKVRAIRAF